MNNVFSSIVQMDVSVYGKNYQKINNLQQSAKGYQLADVALWSGWMILEHYLGALIVEEGNMNCFTCVLIFIDYVHPYMKTELLLLHMKAFSTVWHVAILPPVRHVAFSCDVSYSWNCTWGVKRERGRFYCSSLPPILWTLAQSRICVFTSICFFVLWIHHVAPLINCQWIAVNKAQYPYENFPAPSWVSFQPL